MTLVGSFTLSAGSRSQGPHIKLPTQFGDDDRSLHSLSGSVPTMTSAHVPSDTFVFTPMHAWQRPSHATLQQTPSVQMPLEHSASIVHAKPFGKTAHAWTALQVVAPGHSASGSVLVAIGPHVPFVPEPFLAVEHAWQVPLQALLQQTPSTQFPLVHSALIEHAAPFVKSKHDEPPLHDVAPAHSLSGSRFAAIAPHVPSAPEFFFVAVQALQSVLQTELQQTPSTQKLLVHSPLLVQLIPFASSEHVPAPLHDNPPKHSLSGSRPTPMLPQTPLTPEPFFTAVQAWQVPVQPALQQTPSTQKPLTHSVPSTHASPFGALQTLDPLQTSDPAHSLSGSRFAAIVPHVPSAPEPFFAAVQALQSVLQTELQQTPSTQKPLVHSPLFVQLVPFASSEHAPAPLHDNPPKHSLSGSRPTPMLPQTPLTPEPFFTAVQAWQVPVQTALQQTPSAQKPLTHSVPSTHASPFGALQRLDPLQTSDPAHSLSGSRFAAIVPHVPSAPEPFFAAVQALQSVLQTELQQTPSAQKPLVHSPLFVQLVPFASSEHAPVPLHDNPPKHSLSGSRPAPMLPQTPLTPEPFFTAVQAWQVPVQTALQQTPSAQKPLTHSVPSTHASPFGALHTLDPLQTSDPAHSLSGSRFAAIVPHVPSAPEPLFAAVQALQSVLQTELQQTPSMQKPLVHSPPAVHAVPFAESKQVPDPPHELPPKHSLSGSRPTAMLPQTPLTPEPFFVAVQAWQRPVHAALQQTPSAQKPLTHSVPSTHASPFGALQTLDPLQTSEPAHSSSGSRFMPIVPHVPSAPEPFFAGVQALHSVLQTVLQQTPSTQKPLVHSPPAVQAVPFAASKQAPDPLHELPPKHSLSGSRPAPMLPQTPLTPEPFFVAVHARQGPVHAALQQTPSAQKPLTHSVPSAHVSPFGALQTLDPLQTSEPAHSSSGSRFMPIVPHVPSAPEPFFADVQALQSVLQTVLQQTSSTQKPLTHSGPFEHAAPFIRTAHAPFEQPLPEAQATPHAPQFAGSFLVSAHFVPHFVVPPPHWRPHAPCEQTSPCGQGALQPPQFVGSTFVSTHFAPHFVVPPAHSSAQALCEQTSPLTQKAPQAPQFAGSTAVSTHFAPHFVVPPAHSSAQAPCEQTSPSAQGVPQEPQLSGSDIVSTQLAPHLVVVPAHSALQAPREHTSSAAQVCPHCPQLAGSSSRVTHAPSQFCSSDAQPPPAPAVPPVATAPPIPPLRSEPVAQAKGSTNA
jgi:hypothetical protein